MTDLRFSFRHQTGSSAICKSSNYELTRLGFDEKLCVNVKSALDNDAFLSQYF